MTSIVLGPFTLTTPIARGGMGEVWSGAHASGGAVAVKLLTANRSRDRTFREAFREETRAVAALDHHGIVRVFDFGEVDRRAAAASAGRLLTGTPYLVMELVDGGSLSARRGALGWRALKRVLLDVLAALAHAHSRGVVHRDIKPGNVLVAPGGSVKLTDFGLAHALVWSGSDVAEPARLGGTPQYMAPEQLRGEWRDFGPWTDLYAVGCLAWSLATGHAPFPDRNRLTVMKAHLTQELPALEPRHHVAAGFEGWLHALLHKDPQHRLRRAADAAWGLLALRDPPEDAEELDEVEAGVGAGRSTLFWTVADLPSTPIGAPLRSASPPPRFERPPVPSDWRALPPRASDLRLGQGPLLGAGLGLYELRNVPLVGRDAERELLWSALRKSRTQARAVVLTGPVGCGKGRLAQWVCERAHEVGAATVLHAHHSPDHPPPLGLRRMVGRHLGCIELTRLEVEDRVRRWLWTRGVVDEVELQALCALIAPGLLDRWLRYGTPAQRHAVAAQFMARETEDRPVVVWVDDAQWASDTLGFVIHVLQHHPELPVLFVVSARDEALARRIGEQGMLQQLSELPRVERLDLGGLPPAESALLVRELLGLEPELADRVQARTGGNPAFAVQLVGDWVARGCLVASDSGFRLVDGVDIELPDDLYGMWAGTLSRLGRERGALSALEIAAALGHRVDQAEWVEACRLARAADPLPLAERLVRRRLFEVQPGGWTFAHPMLRESVGRTARESGSWAAAHQWCAQVLVALEPDAAARFPERLGRHLLAAGRPEPAEPLLLEGAVRLSAACGFREALALLGRRDRAIEALALADHDPRVVAGQLARAQAYLAQGRPHLAVQWVDRAAPHAAGAQAARAGQLRAQLQLQRGEIELAQQTYLDAIEGFRDANRAVDMADCLLGLARVTQSRGRFDRARTLCREALQRYQDAGESHKHAETLQVLGDVVRNLGAIDEALALTSDARERFTALGSTSGVARAERQLGTLCTLAARYPAAREHLGVALGLANQLGDAYGQHTTLNALAEVERFEDRLGTAEALYRRSIALGESMGPFETVLPRVNLGLVILRRGRPEEALVMLDEVVTTLENAGMDPLLGGVEIARMTCHASLRQLDGVERTFRRGRHLLDQTGQVDPDVAWVAEWGAEALWQAGERDWARAAWELAGFQWQALGRDEDAQRVRVLLRGRFDPTPSGADRSEGREGGRREGGREGGPREGGQDDTR